MSYLVYRIEHKESRLGLFTHKENGEYIDLICKIGEYYDDLRKKSKVKIYRTIGNDLIGEFNFNMRCGCLTLEDINYWFKPFLTEIFCNGFRIFKYEVRQIYETKSKKQVAFNIKDVINYEIEPTIYY